MKERDKLWKEFHKTKDAITKDALILEYVYIVKINSKRIYQGLPNSVEIDDLISYGTFGLIDAIDRYNPEKNAAFETYATLRVRGAIYDGLRKMDWAPQSLRRKAKKLERAYNDLLRQKGTEPSESEVAKYLDMDLETYQKELNNAGSLTIYSLEQSLESYDEETFVLKDFLKDDKNPLPDKNIEKMELRDILLKKMKELNEKERLVISLIYYEELTTKEVAKVLELSEGRISQIHKKAILKLKDLLEDY